MTSNPDGKGRIGKVRSIGGLVLFVLGLALMARILQLAVFLWGHFSHDEVIRAVSLFWLGAVLAATGGWLAFRVRAAVRALAMLLFMLLLVVVACS